MATGQSIMKRMHEYEARVLTALGFKPDDPVVLRECSPGDETISFKWYGPGDPSQVRTRHGYMAMEAAWGDGVAYWLHASHLVPGVWDTILEARREWESNFPAARP